MGFKNCRRVFDLNRKRLPRYGYKSPKSLADEFARWLEKHTDATHIEINPIKYTNSYEVSWLEPDAEERRCRSMSS